MSQFSPASASHTSEKPALATGQQFLRLYLVPETKVLLSIHQLSEVLTIPIGQIVSIPHMPAWVMGVYNWRGTILWMVDLGQLIGLTPWNQQSVNSSSYISVVFQDNSDDTETNSTSHQIGLVVSNVEDLEWCDPTKFQDLPPSMMKTELASFFRGYWLKPNGEMLVVLDGEAIMAAMPQP